MTDSPIPTPVRARTLATAALCLALSCFVPATSAAPGAHGPDGEHLDAPGGARATSTALRLEANTEQFELVATASAGELLILVDRYETNEPVLGAKLEVESGGLKATATFQPERGAYVVTDAGLLKRLATPGEHALVFTLVAGSESDLLDGRWVVARPAAQTGQDHGHDHGDDHSHSHSLGRAAWLGGGLLGLLLLSGSFWWWRWRRERSSGANAGQGSRAEGERA